MKITNVEALKKIAIEVRKDIIEEVYSAKSGHPGGALSCADILTVLYFNQMNIDEKKPEDPNRDRLILSKGHASPALYAVLAEKGYFPKEELKNFRKIGSKLQGHPDMKNIPGVDMTTGSLGQGLSAGVGMALASKMDKAGCKIYCILGDGEIEEGQVWEALTAASKNKLDNLCVILDNNNLQIDGEIEKVGGMSNITEKLLSFGFNVVNINGHNIDEIIDAITTAKQTKGKPTAIIAKTVKGKGISFMENNASWHGKAPNEEEYNLAIEELNKSMLEI
jgi:transketolase